MGGSVNELIEATESLSRRQRVGCENGCCTVEETFVPSLNNVDLSGRSGVPFRCGRVRLSLHVLADS